MDFFGCVREGNSLGGWATSRRPQEVRLPGRKNSATRRYNGKGAAVPTRRIVENTPSRLAGHSMLCPYNCKGESFDAALLRGFGGGAPGSDVGYYLLVHVAGLFVFLGE